jgi:putative transcriptional regulator
MDGRRRECIICKTARQQYVATGASPFHFTDSGLPNVYLIGIKYYSCQNGHTVAEIPAIEQLLTVIARDLVNKPEALTGDEVRFLRKRIGKKAAEFAKEIGIEPETLSRIENSRQLAGEPTDKLIRLRYAVSSNDEILLEELAQEVTRILTAWVSSTVSKKIVKSIKNNEWSEARAA